MELVTRVLLVANRTATELPLIEAVRRRAERGSATFHLVVRPRRRVYTGWSTPRTPGARRPPTA
jgi:hypothetical protein